jgi:hypothetical protein
LICQHFIGLRIIPFENLVRRYFYCDNFAAGETLISTPRTRLQQISCTLLVSTLKLGVEGYPSWVRKKMCACLVTYQHSGAR